MKYLFALCCFLSTVFLFPGVFAGEWYTDFEKAKAESLNARRPIYILFTNSDAAACLGFERAIFSQKKFQDYADKNLVLMKADFPKAIHRQPKGIAAQNQKLKITYGVTSFPTAFLLYPDGRVYIDFVEADGSVEKHRRKLHEIMDFEAPKRYTDYLDGFVKEYVAPTPVVKPKKADPKPADKKQGDKKPADKKQGDKKPAKNTEEKPKETEEQTVVIEKSGTPLIPLDPKGDLQDWLNSSSTEATEAKTDESKQEAKPAEETKEDVKEEAKPAEKTKEDVKEETKEDAKEAEAEQTPAPAAD